ncbi:MAG: heme-binding protein [Streptococcaceae bacterium]|jgi:uncharacterized protein GlcG (DUF336 family)|nr:heme-binding protein [Streptococcaceae bacterium]
MEDNLIEEIIAKGLHEIQTDKLFSKENLFRTINLTEQMAQKIHVSVTICITDRAGTVLISYHMQEANLVSVTLAPKKALSALMMKSQTKDLNKETNPQASLYNMETMMDGRLVTFAGGIPIKLEEKIIGAIGVSGGLVEEDQMLCETAVAAFLKGE